MSESPKKTSAVAYIQSLLNKNLRVLVTDGRMFIGQLRCTDPDSNIILAHTYEYRRPSSSSSSSTPSPAANGTPLSLSLAGATSRYIGLVIVPGQHIVRIDLEEFASQSKKSPPKSQQQQQQRALQLPSKGVVI